MLAFSNDYYGMIFRATQSVELFCAYNESALQINYRQMKAGGNVEFLGIYKKLNDSQLLDVMTQ